MRARVGRLLLGAALVGLIWPAGSALADHAGETVELSKSEDVQDGETITVTFSNFLKEGENAVNVIMANTWPVRGPEAFNLAEFDPTKTYPVNPDGTGELEFVATIDHGTFNCLEIQCYVVVFQGIGSDSYTGGAPIAFAAQGGGEAPEETEPPATEAPETTAAPETTEAPEETEPPAAEAPAETEAPDTTAPAEEGDDGGSGALLWIILAAVVVAAIAGGVVYARRGKGAIS